MQICSIKWDPRTHWKDHLPQSSSLHSRNKMAIFNTKINTYNVPHKQTQRQIIPHDHFIIYGNGPWENATLHDKILERLRIYGAYFNITKTVCSKLIVNINLNEEEIKVLPLKSRTKQNCSLSSYLFNIILEVLCNNKSEGI